MVPEEERGQQILILRRFLVQESFFFLIPGICLENGPDPPGDLVDAETAGDIPLVRFMEQRGNEIIAGVIDIRIVLMDKGTVDGFTV